MPRHLLVYWPWDIMCYEFENIKILAHDASNQFEHRHIEPGDILWYVTVPVDDGRFTGQLVLFGHLEVAAILHTNTEAQRYLIDSFGLTYTVRQDANIHIFACPGTQEPYNLLDITALAGALRFDSPNGRDRLTIHEGRVAKTFELRAMRVLAPSGIFLLSEVWQGRTPVDTPPPPDKVLPPIAPDEEAFPEGAVKQRLHLARERNRELVARAKQHFKKQHDDRLFCEVCGFDFAARYGPIGEDYIEAHHTIPVSELTEESVTRIKDLAIVCSNCHRMLHRRRPWLTMDELRQILV